MTPTPRRAGFSVMELVISVSLLAVLAGTLAPAFADQRKAARDSRRLRDLKTIVSAVERFLAERGRLPDADREPGHGGWDTTLDGAFVTELVTKGYLREPPRDPKNDALFHYRYCRYPAGTSGFAADSYVVGLTGFETAEARRNKGYWRGRDRDWSAEFAYVTGGVSR